MDNDGWPDVVEVLQASGQPWPRSAAVFDLRWHYDRDGRVPGRRALRERWGWTDRQARGLLADTDAWWDPSKGPAPTGRVPRASRERPASVPRVSRERPGTGAKEEEEPSAASRLCPASVPPLSRERPASVHTRIDPPSPSPSPSPPQAEVSESGSAQLALTPPEPDGPDLWQEAIAVYDEVVRRQCGQSPRGLGSWSRTGGQGAELRRICGSKPSRRHRAEVLRVLYWWAFSPSAEWLRVGRSGKPYQLDTIRRKFAKYADDSADDYPDFDPDHPPTGPPTSAGPRGTYRGPAAPDADAPIPPSMQLSSEELAILYGDHDAA